MAEWIANKPVTAGLLAYLLVLVVVYGFLYWLIRRDHEDDEPAPGSLKGE